MKKSVLFLLAFAMYASALVAQNVGVSDASVTTLECDDTSPATRNFRKTTTTSTTTVLWSEDFSAGIPSGWINQGYAVDPSSGNITPNSATNWEYRGPSTTPSNAIGSRGRLAGSGPTILSPTASNGFIIFDSDYLDSDGIARGAGVSPAPHIGTLSTDTIDLTGYSHVELAFHSRARKYASIFQVAVSNDGGVSFSDTIEMHKGLGTNSTSNSEDEVAIDISNTAGNQAMVVIMFIFDGRPSGSSGPGLYYWQIDDLEIRELAAHSFRFTSFGDAPAHDILYPQNSQKYGHIPLNQAVPITFDSNVLNYGYQDQTNVRLIVNIEDLSGNSVASLTSPTLPVLNSSDTADFNDLTTTTSWTPSAVGAYNVIFTMESDSIPTSPNADTPYDTIVMHVTDETHNDGRYSFSFGSIDNYVGTDNLANGEILAIGEAFNFTNPNKDTTGFVFIDGASVPFSSATDPTAIIFWEVYDTTGFTYGNGGGPVGLPIWESQPYQLDSTIPGTTHYFDFTTVSGNDTMPVALPSGAGYHIIMNMLPNPPGTVRIGNDQTIRQPTGTVKSVVVQSSQGNWFGRFNNSFNLSSPILNVFMAERPLDDNTALEVWKLQNQLKVYPNPSNGIFSVAIGERGTYTLELKSMTGKSVYSESVSIMDDEEVLRRDFSNLAKGIYLLNVRSQNFHTIRKITIE